MTTTDTWLLNRLLELVHAPAVTRRRKSNPLSVSTVYILIKATRSSAANKDVVPWRVIVGAPLGRAERHRQDRRGPVQRLDLTFSSTLSTARDRAARDRARRCRAPCR